MCGKADHLGYVAIKTEDQNCQSEGSPPRDGARRAHGNEGFRTEAHKEIFQVGSKREMNRQQNGQQPRAAISQKQKQVPEPPGH